MGINGRGVVLLPCLLAQYGRAPLLLAAERGNSGVVQCLLEHGADVDATKEVRCNACDVMIGRIWLKRYAVAGATCVSAVFVRAGWMDVSAACCEEGSHRGGSVPARSWSRCQCSKSGTGGGAAGVVAQWLEYLRSRQLVVSYELQ